MSADADLSADSAGEPTIPGLRERKKAEMRQRISDVATRMFLERSYDAVRVADIAASVGVSEKTVFNYFPTKESLVLDQADQQLEDAIAAVSRRPSGVSPTQAYVVEVKRQLQEIADPDFSDARELIPRFAEMLETTPALRAAWGNHRDRLVSAVADVLAADLGADPREPEPLTAARALISLTELSFDSLLRHVATATSAPELLARVEADLDRAARLLDTGIWPPQATAPARAATRARSASSSSKRP